MALPPYTGSAEGRNTGLVGRDGAYNSDNIVFRTQWSGMRTHAAGKEIIVPLAMRRGQIALIVRDKVQDATNKYLPIPGFAKTPYDPREVRTNALLSIEQANEYMALECINEMYNYTKDDTVNLTLDTCRLNPLYWLDNIRLAGVTLVAPDDKPPAEKLRDTKTCDVTVALNGTQNVLNTFDLCDRFQLNDLCLLVTCFDLFDTQFHHKSSEVGKQKELVKAAMRNFAEQHPSNFNYRGDKIHLWIPQLVPFTMPPGSYIDDFLSTDFTSLSDASVYHERGWETRGMDTGYISIGRFESPHTELGIGSSVFNKLSIKEEASSRATWFRDAWKDMVERAKFEGKPPPDLNAKKQLRKAALYAAYKTSHDSSTRPSTTCRIQLNDPGLVV